MTAFLLWMATLLWLYGWAYLAEKQENPATGASGNGVNGGCSFGRGDRCITCGRVRPELVYEVP